MKTLTIIICFEYEHNHLSSSISDLLTVYNFAKEHKYDTVIYTDIGMPELNCLNRYHSSMNILNDMYEISLDYNRILFYYSGHGKGDRMMLPSNESISFLEVRKSLEGVYKNDILDNSSNSESDVQNNIEDAEESESDTEESESDTEESESDTESDISIHSKDKKKIIKDILCIIDTCFSSAMNLPFILDNNIFRVRISSTTRFTKHNILVFTSLDEKYNAVACSTGSLLTTHIFEYLKRLSQPYNFVKSVPISLNRNLQRMVNELENKILGNGIIKVDVHSSHLRDPVLWNWIGRSDSVSIKSDDSMTAIFLQY
jgi:hypothetical protein